MRNRIARAAVVGVTSLASVLTFASAAPTASGGPGTFTRITTPSADLYYRYNGKVPATSNQFTVLGQASADVSAVNVYCMYTQAGSVQAAKFAGPVAVVNGGFTATAAYPFQITNCRLRAVPSTIATPATAYLGSYSGPVLHTDTLIIQTDASAASYRFDAAVSQAEGYVSFGDAGACGIEAFTLAPTPGLEQADGAPNCMLRLAASNIGPANIASGSTIQVDGHNAFLPYSVHAYLKFQLSLPVAATSLSVSLGRDANGDATLTETSPLMRCIASDVYPPTLTSCSALTDTGVGFTRVVTYLRGGDRIRVRDAFTSADGAAHAVALEYQARTSSKPSGTQGAMLPGQGAFSAPSPDQVVTGFGAGAATMYLRSDILAAPDEPTVTTTALTWSRSPAPLVFSHQGVDWFGLRYGVAVPAGGSGSIGFAVSEAQTTAGAQALAAADRADMMAAPAVTSPAGGARIGIRTTTVSGQLAAGANGLPLSVTVNGVPASITPTGASTATFSARVSLPWGTHAVPVVATDAGGNTRSASVVVTNTPALATGNRARLSRSTLLVPVSCRAFSAGTCTGRIVVKSTRGAVLGKTGAFGVRRGRAASVGMRIRPGVHVVRVYLYQREPTGAYVLVATKTYHV